MVDRATGKAIRGAHVEFRHRSGKPPSVTPLLAGEGGRFSVELEPDDYYFGVNAWGYRPTTQVLSVFQELSEVTVELAKARIISGRIQGCEDTPCIVSLAPRDGSEVKWTGTEPDGRFRTAALEDTSYALCAGSEGRGWAVLTDVAAGTEDIAMEIQPPGRLVLSIHGPDGRPLAGVLPTVSASAGARVFMAYPGGRSLSDGAGRLELRVPSGPLEIDLRAHKLRGSIQVQVEPHTTVSRDVALTEAGDRP